MAFDAKQLVVISGKGGTGKTSIVASFAALAEKVVLADCDVDAADLHLVLEPKITRRESFSGGKRARMKSGHCTACGKCEEICRFGAIFFDGPGNGKVDKTFRIDPIACEGCGVCAWFCPENAIEFAPAVNGEWYVSDTRHGPMVHAKLGIAEENSGKLVSTVRKEAGAIAHQRNLDLVLIDGSPGIGCPVIASITGADQALIVTEPTLSGLHDLGRVADVARHFEIPGMVCVNKWDLNPNVAAEIERQAQGRGLTVAGRVRYDRAVTEAQIRKQSVVEYQSDGCAEDIRNVWASVENNLIARGTRMNDTVSRQVGDRTPLVLGIAGSERRQGNSATLLRRVSNGLNGEFRTELVFLADIEMRPCAGCHYCQKKGACCVKDGMAALYSKLIEADVILLASPAYMGGIASRMQAFMERTWPLRKGQLAGKLASYIVTGRRRIGMATGVMEEYFTRLGVTKLPGVLGFAFESGEVEQDREAVAQAERLAADVGDLLRTKVAPERTIVAASVHKE